MAMHAKTERLMKRWQEQRWIIDSIIRTDGIEWDQPRIGYTLYPCGLEGVGDFRTVSDRVRKFTDIHREFAAAGARREKKAQDFDAQGRMVAARESYFIAALLYSQSRWPIYENTDKLIHYNDRMRANYAKYVEYAPHPIVPAEVPFDDSSLPGHLHLPHKPAPGEKFPAVIGIDGMDGSKEIMCSMYGDKFLQRGIANFTFDGPGQGECCIRNIHVTPDNHRQSTKAVYDWLVQQPHIDPDRIAMWGLSFGSYFGLQGAAELGDKIKGVAVTFVCHEPGGNVIFNQASPTFKLRFMYMSGYQDEDEFDRFVEKFDLRGTVQEITAPVLVQAGEDDELSPIEYSHELIDRMTCPRELVEYQGDRHAIGSSSAAALGENWLTMIADWILDRLDDKPVKSRRVTIDPTGQRHETPI